MIKYKCFVMAAFLMLALAGCGGSGQATVAVLDDTNRKMAVTVADPQEAVVQIYASLEDYKAVPLSAASLKRALGLKDADFLECYGKVSEPEEGLADVMIILPNEGREEDVRLALSKYKEQRMSEFENYDILDAYSIAQNAVIYPQGEYTILLMLADNDSARSIIDEYIPL